MDLIDICNNYPSLLEEILSGLHQAMILTDGQGRVIYSSRMVEKIIGFSSEDLFDQELAKIFTHEDLVFLYPNILFLAKNQQIFEGELMLRRKNETRFFAYLVTRSFQLDRSDRMVIAFCIEDIDKQKHFEKALRETHFEDLIKIANGIAHELRNPLTSLGGFINRLFKTGQTSVTHEQYHDFIFDNLRRIENLVKKVDYLVSLPKPDFKMEPAKEVIDQALVQYRPDMAAKGIVLNLDVDEVMLLVDRGLFCRVVSILVENALDAMSGPGCLTIDSRIKDNHYEIHVTDTGSGITPEDLPFIFNPFFSTKPSGAGIDLAVVKRIMISHGGRVEAESTPGQKTTFILYFPMERRRTIRIAPLEPENGVSPEK
ncbi:MAG: PAS domain S-box protein [Deltaproteobacteria bacterium]|nr:PAS domain S-box protein [Deltaproteobacteria bacterium]